ESPRAPRKVPPQIPVKFVDVTREAGLITKAASESVQGIASALGPGACFLDYDNDGKIDIFLPQGGAQGGMALYQNVGGGRFEDVTRKAGLELEVHGFGCAAGDYENDGVGEFALGTARKGVRFHNERNGGLTD